MYTAEKRKHYYRFKKVCVSYNKIGAKLQFFLFLGIIISNNSLLKLWDDLKNNYDEQNSYLTTRKLNQDLVENSFSYLKGMFGSTSHNITVLDFKYKYSLLG